MVVSILIRREPKSISTDNTPAMNDTIFPYYGLRLNLCSRENRYIVIDLSIGSYINIRIYFDIVSDGNLFSDVGKGTNIVVVTIGSRFCYIYRLLNSSFIKLYLIV